MEKVMLKEDKTDQKLLEEVADLQLKYEELKKDIDRDEVTGVILAVIFVLVDLFIMYNIW